MREKNFNLWNEQKKDIDKKDRKVFFHVREIWFCYVGDNVGHEQNGGRNFLCPVLIIKKFNQRLFLSIPLTSQEKTGEFYLPISKVRKKNATVILSQMRLYDVNRLEEKIETLPKQDFDIITKTIRGWFE